MVKSLGDKGTDATLPYDVLHAVPHQSAPDWIKSSVLSTGDANGYVDIHKHTMQHVTLPQRVQPRRRRVVPQLQDRSSDPQTGSGRGREHRTHTSSTSDSGGEYHGYASCPLVTSSHDMLLAEFDYR